MSINACTLNLITTDDLCRRGAILATLPPWVPTPTPLFVPKSHPQHVSENAPNLNIYRRDPNREEVVEETVILEQPIITVTIEFNGESFIQTMDRGDENFRPMINVYGLSVGEPVSESVNISDIKLKVLS